MAESNDTKHRELIYLAIEQERELQDLRFGGTSNDDLNSDNDWWMFINKHSSRAAEEYGQDRRYSLIRVAALAVAAVEAFDRKL